MKSIIYVNQTNTIVPESALAKNVTWEIDDDEHLKIQVSPEGIIIRPGIEALNKPGRALRWTAEETGATEEIEVVIEPAVNEGASEMDELAGFPRIPMTMKTGPQETVLIPGTENLPDDIEWSFSENQYNSYLRLDIHGVSLDHLPPGLYTLLWQRGNVQHGEIVIQSIGVPKEQEATPSKPKASGTRPRRRVPNDVPDKSKTDMEVSSPVEEPPEDSGNPRKDWPKTTKDCALVIGSSQERFPITCSKTLLIGKGSRHQRAVDIDLREFTSSTDRISRNHLKIWLNDTYLMMKNIGSHRVYYGGQEVGPGQIAVLRIGGEVRIGDVVIRIVEE